MSKTFKLQKLINKSNLKGSGVSQKQEIISKGNRSQSNTL